MSIEEFDIEELAFEGIDIYVDFKDKKPKFGDIFTIVGYEHIKFKAEIEDFKLLSKFDFEQVDDFFGIPNDTEIGDDVKIWLFPIINDEEVYHNPGPYEGIKLSYNVLRNPENVSLVLEQIFNTIQDFKLKMEFFCEGKKIESFDEVKPLIQKIKDYCENELNVELGSDEALELD